VHAKTFRETGMGRSFYRAAPANMVEHFDKGGTFYHQASGRSYQMIRRDERYFARRSQKGFGGKEENVVEMEIHYVMGSGNHARSYLHRTAENRLLQMPLTWYPDKGGYWAMSPGYDNSSHLDFRRKIGYDCMFCHNAYPAVENDLAQAEPVYPAHLPEGIDCQRCHGLGSTHVSAAQKTRPAAEIRAAIVNPARLSAERQIELCMQCHLETTSTALPNSLQRFERGAFSLQPGESMAAYLLHFDHAPGSGRDDKFEIVSSAYRLRQSACFLKSGGTLQCTTCHNPHQAPRGEAARVHYTVVCRTCHGGSLQARIDGGKHPQQTDCVSCHMPQRRTEDVVHAVMTDHLIQRRKPARNLVAPLAERHEIEGVSSYQGEVVAYYPRSLSGGDELYLALAQVTAKSNLKEGIPRLESAIRKHQPKHPEFYSELGQAYLAAERRDDAIAMYRAALERDPRFLPAIRSLGAALLKAGDRNQAQAALERARGVSPRDPTTLHELGRAYQQLGRLPEAAATIQEAVRSDPDFPEAHDTLGLVYFESGDRARAEGAHREAIRQQPDFASAHSNLANVLISSGNFDEAEYHLQTAMRLAPRDPVAYYSFGGLLASRRRFDEARVQLQTAVRLRPDFAEAREILGNLAAMRGDWRGARREYEEALRVQPQFGRALLGLGTALAALRDFAGARTYLEKAAADHNPQVRQEASELLQELAGQR
jgi:predicted CXXCH cytochrome family protein